MNTFKACLATGFLMLVVSIPIHAVEIRSFEDPAKAERYETLIHKLRCLVCQNQSLGDSDADLAKDLRNEVYERIESGESEAETLKFLTDRYGDFVLYDPPLKGITLFLWMGPVLLFLAGGFLALRHLFRHRSKDRLTALDEAALKRLEALKTQIRNDSHNAP